jgi:hypothetical protein
MTGVVRCDTAANDRVPVTMFANLGMLLDKTEHELVARYAAIVGRGAPTQRSF